MDVRTPVSSARLLHLTMTALILAGCRASDGDGYLVWVVNESPEPVFILFRGESSLGDVPNPAAASYLASPGTRDIPGPFIYVDETHAGSITLVDASCQVIERFDLRPGDFGVKIAEDGTASLREYGFGQRPSTTEQLAATKDCLGM